jgi:N-acetylglucosaminyl-diphospho-decaprenol L-rhamnosyltransferase
VEVNPITALIITYNSADHIAPCVQAAAAYCDEVLVVDNASTDATLQRIPPSAAVRVIASRTNLGFAGGVNLGMREARHEMVLLLNPDAVLLDDPAPLLTDMEATHAAVAAGLLVDESGAAQKGFSLRRFPTPAALALESLGINRLWPSNPVNRHWRALDLDLTRGQDVEQPAGAFLLIRKTSWLAVGGFDDRFHPVWFEDVDFLQRVHTSGQRIRYLPTVRACHAGGHSVNRISSDLQKQYWYGSLFKYAGKHFSPAQRRAVALAVAIGAVARGSGRVFRLAAREVFG